MFRKFLVTAGVSAALVVPLAGTATAAPAIEASAAETTTLAAAPPCTKDVAVTIGGTATAAGLGFLAGGPFGAAAGAVGALIPGAFSSALCMSGVN